MNEFTEKTYVVTGAAGGIGRETVRLFHESGARLVLIDRDAAGLEALCKDLNGGDRIISVASDIASPQACARTLDGVGGHLHGLVHLAGLFEPDHPEPEYRPVWDRALAANLTNAYDMVNACLPRFDPDVVGRMVFVSSLAFRRGSYDHIGYTAAKGGIVGLVRALSRRLAPAVLVNGLAPGIIDTPMPSRIIAERGDELRAGVPLGRFGHPREVASVIGFLCGDGSSYVTGQIVNVDGGLVNN